MGYLTIIASVVIFILLFKFGFKQVKDVGLKLIFSFTGAGMLWICILFVSLFSDFYPIKEWTVSKTTDTTFMQPLPDQSYYMVNTDPYGNKSVSYFHKGEICSRTITKCKSVFIVDINIKCDSNRNYKFDSINKIFLPYLVRYTITSNDSTLQRAFFGFTKRSQIDTLFIRDIKLLKIINQDLIE